MIRWLVENAVACCWAALCLGVAAVILNEQIDRWRAGADTSCPLWALFAVATVAALFIGLVQRFIYRRPPADDEPTEE
jgi:hypothetical protein